LKTKPGALVDSPAHLVDVLPTLADISGAKIPATWPGREPSPLAGVSLKPILDGKPVTSRPPIHLLFASDRGLRDGDWKLVSFQSEPWELYNLAQDRTELHNVAAQHPDIVKRMEQQWTDMAKNVLQAPAREYQPVAATTSLPHKHAQWTDYASLDASSARHDAAKQKKRAKKTEAKAETARDEGSGIRARVNTKLTVDGDELVLACSGNDSGLSFDRLPELKVHGPYKLVFSLKSTASGEGGIYWTLDAATKLPKGQQQTFAVRHDGEWQQITLKIDTEEKLYALRLDPCSAPGAVRIKELKLLDAAGQTLHTWPAH
ncbi:MAG: arylsulfatase, partial [Kiritimatiellaeota bacterium]|nr:arylsulfatase [Kiritimatiellota bacterium]